MSAFDTPRGRLSQIGNWELGTTLGRGAYAHVRLATHVHTGHQAACKILPSLYHTPGIAVSRNDMMDAVEAHKEVVLLKALAGAKVPGVVGLEGVMEEGGWTYVFLTLYPHSLGSFIERNKSENDALVLFRKLLRTVDTLHQLGVSHEDIKRSNVLVDMSHAEPHPILVDFGFAHINPPYSKVRSLGGTYDYSSPEKGADQWYDPRANEVWTLGILLMKILNIAHPYVKPDLTSKENRQNIINGEPQWRWKPRDTTTNGRAGFIMAMLERNPKYRPTIPEILNHRYLQRREQEPVPQIKIPPMRLSTKVPRPVSQGVIQDISFLAYINNDFFLCESTKVIEQRVLGREPCWEQRWATMLAGWEQKCDQEWEDIPATLPQRLLKTPPLIRRRTFPGLQEIYLSPLPPSYNPPKSDNKDGADLVENESSSPFHFDNLLEHPLSETPTSPSSPDEVEIPLLPAEPFPPRIKRAVKILPRKPAQSPTLQPRKVVAVSRTMQAAVAGPVKKVTGPGGFGRSKMNIVATRKSIKNVSGSPTPASGTKATRNKAKTIRTTRVTSSTLPPSTSPPTDTKDMLAPAPIKVTRRSPRFA